MDPQQLPLEPLIAPPPVGWWPLAPIWWILMAGFALLILVIIVRRVITQRTNSPKTVTSPVTTPDSMRQTALKVLNNLPIPYDQPAGEWLQHINDLLKRICNSQYPTENSKVLIGHAWLNFLDSKCPTAHINQFTMLVDGEYQANYCIDKTTLESLYSALEHWITYYV